jgi:hypothetical protein
VLTIGYLEDLQKFSRSGGCMSTGSDSIRRIDSKRRSRVTAPGQCRLTAPPGTAPFVSRPRPPAASWR